MIWGNELDPTKLAQVRRTIDALIYGLKQLDAELMAAAVDDDMRGSGDAPC